jgi:hypothetical protein
VKELSSNKWERVRGINTHPQKTSLWVVKFQNLRRLQTQKLAVRSKTGPETSQKCLESLDKVSISLFSEIFRISTKFSKISKTFGVSAKIFRVSLGLPDSLGDLRENAITYYFGLQI